MQRRVRTPDDVGWTVSVRRPAIRGSEGDLVVGAAPDGGGGFGPLVVVAAVVLLLVTAPALVNSGRGWWLAIVPVLLAVAWVLLARYPVEVRRDGASTPLHRTLVAGRRRARKVADELADEITRTPDDQLTG